MHDLASAYLEKAGHHILSAYSGRDGLECIINCRPDVVLLDYSMPGMNGEEVYATLRNSSAFQEFRDIPVIFLTAMGSDRELKQRLIQQGANAYLHKPFGLKELGNILDNLFIINDFRERNRELESRVKKTEDYLEQVIQRAPVGILTTDIQGNIVESNFIMDGIIPLKGEQPEGEKMNVFQHHLTRDTFIAIAVKEVLVTGNEWKQDRFRWISPNGDDAFLRASFVPLSPGSQDKIRGTIGIIEDITSWERQNYELNMIAQIGLAMQAPLSLEELVHLLLTAITAGQALGFTRAALFTLDPKESCFNGYMGIGPGDESEAQTTWARLKEDKLDLQGALHKYGRRIPLKTNSFNAAVKRIALPLNKKYEIVRNILEKIPFRYEKQARNKTILPQEFLPLGLDDYVAVPLITNDQLWGMIIADTKYTRQAIPPKRMQLLNLLAGQAAHAVERARAYEQLEKEKLKLEGAYKELRDTHERLLHSERLAAIGGMAAHVAHEIRNPLVTIGGLARRLHRHSDSGNNKNSALSIIVDEVLRLEKILADVLNFTRLPGPQMQENDLNHTIASLCEQIYEELAHNNIQLKVDFSHIKKFRFDDVQIRQVLLNLIKNGEQAINSNGIISIKTEQGGETARIIFEDSGAGIPSDELDAIFTPFFTTKKHGTGIGLAISQQIIHDHGGKIDVHSEEGKGTCFIIELPTQKEDQAAH